VLVSLRRSGWIIISLFLFFSAITIAQEQTPPPGDFTVGSPIKNKLIDFPNLLIPFQAAGFNTIWQRAESYTKEPLEAYNLIALNEYTSAEYIFHYSTAYYSKWEAEIDAEAERVGFKHRDSLGNLIGSSAIWNGKSCWSSLGLSGPRDSLVYGPHYRQEKRYKRWNYGCISGDGCLTYTPRFRMALDNYGDADSTEDVCKIKVVFRYKEDTSPYDFHDITFIERTLKVGDFNQNGNFDDFYLHPDQNLGKYGYWPNFILPDKFMQSVDSPLNLGYIDWESFTGIQFWVDWLRTDTLCTLYIDYAEVYDNNGWNAYIEDPIGVSDSIIAYAQSFSGWDNLIYWTGPDEPYTIDSYLPLHIVDSLIRSVPAPPLVVHFDPSWHWTNKINGEDEIEMFASIAKPEKIILGIYPASPNWPTIRFDDFEWLRFNFQRTWLHDSSFWFKPQAFGLWSNDAWCVWRKPKSPELTSMVMLALAHGSKGILFEWFDSFPEFNLYEPCPNTYLECLVDLEGNPEINDQDTLYNTVKNKLIPRLKGKLGKTLMDLNYTGIYLELRRYMGPNTGETVTEKYLTLSTTAQNPTPFTYYFHAGFFENPNQIGNNHFLLTNLITYDNRWINVGVTDNGSNFTNTRFRNVEPGYGFDTTFTDEFSIDILFPAGEGYLYQVAPVVEYGGRLLYPESVGGGMVLNDDMIIENGATLTIYDNYIARANIIVKNGSIINGENGKIIFKNGKKLIINGTAAISGTAENKLTFEFETGGPETENGIVVEQGASLTITYCIVEDAETGIKAMVEAGTINIQYVDFYDCITSSITLLGQTGGPEIVRQIKYCTITNSTYGISASNLPELLIQENVITNTDYGIYLSIVTSAQIIGNLLQSNREEMAGIYFQSSGGAIRANCITGHSVGIHIANSSPILGSNFITANKYHGLYVGSGSLPYMRMGSFIGGHGIFYATSGYNKIFNNGGYEEEGGLEDNDGSEIYFVNSNAVMDRGCNSIYDDREPNPPLINTELLMNCPFGQEITVNAVRNYWGETEVTVERFGYLDVNFDEYLDDPCPEPQGGGEDELVLRTSFGEVIDTVYSIDVELTELTQTEEAYAEAEGYFLTGDLTNALYIFEGIINSTGTEEEKYLAYKRKYSIGKLTGQSTEYFNQLSNTFSALASNTQDTLNAKILNQLSTLSKVGEQEYETAIGEFDVVIQQNPNSEEAVYAEIDALTTALLLEETDSTLQKGRLGKYLIKSSANYNQRVDEILRKNFGSEAKETEKELLPTEYTLYQNYPNPFNPVTTIKYDLPNTSDVSLIIYDILGRKVKELVNTKQQAGRYEVQFDASNLASGVYIYQLIAEKYMSSRKMILLK
jgi:hypothetical protein